MGEKAGQVVGFVGMELERRERIQECCPGVLDPTRGDYSHPERFRVHAMSKRDDGSWIVLLLHSKPPSCPTDALTSLITSGRALIKSTKLSSSSIPTTSFVPELQRQDRLQSPPSNIINFASGNIVNGPRRRRLDLKAGMQWHSPGRKMHILRQCALQHSPPYFWTSWRHMFRSTREIRS